MKTQYLEFDFCRAELRTARLVRLSVCLSHAGNVSKLMIVGSRGFHRRIAQGLPALVF